jgi:hypothetical protein
MCLSATGAAPATAVNLTTHHYDNLRTGWNSSETALTQSNVGGSSFGLLGTVTVDDQVDAQPLFVSGLAINGAQHDVLYVVTAGNSVYALDAASGQVLRQTNLGTPVAFTHLPGQCNNNGPNVGITSTPVADLARGVLYLIAYTWENSAAVYRIHALSLTTLADSVPPMVITATGLLGDGSTYQFNPGVTRQRAALLLANNTIYAGFSSFCDSAANLMRGWVLGWEAGTLTPVASNKLMNKLPSSPNSFFLSAVWMSGAGPAANAAGSIYFVTGNSDDSGTFNRVTNIEESAVKMSADLTTVQSVFTPSNFQDLDETDFDFGAGGLLLLPPQGNRLPNLAAAAGKDGNLYLLDADRLKRNFATIQVDGCWCAPAYFEGSDGIGRIVTSGGMTVRIWTVKGRFRPTLTLENISGGIANGQEAGFFTSVSSNGTTPGTAIIWAVGRPTDSNPAQVSLYAINADTGQRLFTAVAGQWPNTNSNSNIVPVVANGRVYVASNQTVTIFGLGGSSDVALPKITLTDMRPPLAPGQHEIYGTIEGGAGGVVLVRTRTGEKVRVDTANARRKFRLTTPVIGNALIARGTYDGAGVLHADVVLRAKKNPKLWPADR